MSDASHSCSPDGGSLRSDQHPFANVIGAIARSASDSADLHKPAEQSTQLSGLYRAASDSASNSSAGSGAVPLRRGGYKVCSA